MSIEKQYIQRFMNENADQNTDKPEENSIDLSESDSKEESINEVEREKQPCVDALGREIQPRDIIYTLSNWNGQKKVAGGEVLRIIHDEYGQPQVRLFKKDVKREVVVKSPENYLILDKRGV